jgi:Uma2 family endonuclease
MSSTIRFTSADLEAFPDPTDGARYEIIDGELLISKLPRLEHQHTMGVIGSALFVWSRQTGVGVANIAPGIIISDTDEVVPDVIWISHERLAQHLKPDGKLHGAPELTVEVLSSGIENERRDRKLKPKFYSRIGVEEYWIADWRACTLEVYRRSEGELRLVSTLAGDDILTSPLLPGFALLLGELWELSDNG